MTMIDQPGPIQFTCTLEQTGTDAVVRPAGELDLSSVEAVETRLRQAAESGARRIVLDLREVTFLGSTGLRLVLEWDEASRADGVEFALIRGPRQVERVFELTRVAEQLRFIDG